MQSLRQIFVLKITAFGKGCRRFADGDKAGNRQHAKLANGIAQPRNNPHPAKPPRTGRHQRHRFALKDSAEIIGG